MPTYAFLIFLHLFAVVWGFHGGFTDGQAASGNLFSIGIGTAVVWRCAWDARSRRTPLPGMTPLLMYFAWPVAAPAYIVWSRGWRGVLWSLLWTFTLGAFYTAAAAAGFLLRHSL